MGPSRRRTTIAIAIALPLVAVGALVVAALGGFGGSRPAAAAQGEPRDAASAGATPADAPTASASAPPPSGAATAAVAPASAAAGAPSAVASADASGALASGALASGAAPIGSAARADDAPQRVFVFGDSMVINMLQRVADYCLENGHEYSAAIWYGSSSAGWAWSGKLQQLLAARDPTFVLVVLGSSEITSGETKIGTDAVKQIVSLIGARKYAWVGPLHFRDDKVWNDMMERVNGPGHYFRSTDIKFQDVGDHIHPTPKAAAEWADAVARWISDKSDVPIRLLTPTKRAPKPNPLIFPAPY